MREEGIREVGMGGRRGGKGKGDKTGGNGDGGVGGWVREGGDKRGGKVIICMLFTNVLLYILV